MKKPEGLDSGIALSEYGAVPRDTPAARLEAQMIMHRLVMSGVLSLDEAKAIGYAGAAQPDPFYAMILDTAGDAMSARCPTCDRLVSIRVLRVEPSGRYVYQPLAHDGPSGLCRGKPI